MFTASEISSAIFELRNEQQQTILSRFFKTGYGEYGYGDKFLGLKVPQTRQIVAMARRQVPFSEIETLLHSEWHEIRLCGFLLLVEEMQSSLPSKKNNATEAAMRRAEIVEFYLRHARQANNWDLVDLTCPKILGTWLCHPLADGSMPDTQILDRLADSDNLWEQRIAIVTNWTLIRHDRYDDTFRISDKLLSHPHDLIHKAIGWMLREVGKRNPQALENYLESRFNKMHRTTLRYAIEKMSAPQRSYWLQRK